MLSSSKLRPASRAIMVTCCHTLARTPSGFAFMTAGEELTTKIKDLVSANNEADLKKEWEEVKWIAQELHPSPNWENLRKEWEWVTKNQTSWETG